MGARKGQKPKPIWYTPSLRLLKAMESEMETGEWFLTCFGGGHKLHFTTPRALECKRRATVLSEFTCDFVEG